ncbi:TatD family hydrolase [uncultured Oscillibacter sp.]|jgi:TatD DNase family protein|uniref:TatD family hydrolase n=1 Tax=uncultured Oscillibacter sp. TaxID=876091 RepID=UPI00216B803F|nr:TatD family hydrolase [uncultured Oscillibacter sp.]MCI9554928.1 TatD family hydrolase [Oscillibacter sp.]
MPIFDTHAHYDSNGFTADRDEILSSLPAAGVGLVVDPGCELESSQAAVALAERYSFVYAAAGIHPSDCAGTGEAEFAALRALCGHEKVVAVGEIGLDYYWKDNPPREFQQTVFRRQIELAAELGLPIIVHDREAHGDSLAIVLEYPEVRGVFHCFSGSPEMAEELLKRGWFLGFDGPITYKNAQKAPEVVAVTPLDRIVVETDSPYLSPVPLRGKRNDSRNLPYIIGKLAEWKGVSPEEMTRITWENGLRLFPKIPIETEASNHV